MDYELCKKLKDAGYQIPYNSKGELTCKAQMLARETSSFVSCDHQKCILSLEQVYIPTLEELIEACGEFDCKVTKKDGRFYVIFNKRDKHGNELDFWLSSLEEVFAYYYLEINKK